MAAEMRYIALSTAVTDELHFADGSVKERVAGGAGIYALAGMRLWRDDVGIVTGVGRDYLGLYGDWYARNGLSTEGLLPKDPHTPHNVIRYGPDGERTETPRHGAEHYERIEGTVEDLERFSRGTRGVYIFKNLRQPFWREALDLKRRHGFRLMWEIAADACVPGNLEGVRAVARQCELLSINRAEAMSLLGADSLEQAVRALISWEIPAVFLRVGARGAIAIAGGRAVLAPSVGGAPVVDVTGGGNGFSGGALVGWCETGDPVRAACMGNASAAACIAQYGVPELLDENLRALAARRVEQNYREATYEI